MAMQHKLVHLQPLGIRALLAKERRSAQGLAFPGGSRPRLYWYSNCLIAGSTSGPSQTGSLADVLGFLFTQGTPQEYLSSPVVSQGS